MNANEVEMLKESKEVHLKENQSISKIEKLEDNIVELLLDKTSLGWEHIKIICLLILYVTGEGFVMIGVSLLVPVLTHPWFLTEFQKGFLGSSIFIGFTTGAISSGWVSDKKGRKTSFLIGNVFSLTGGLIGFLFINGVYTLSFSNFFIGLGIGISIPAIMTLISEITNSHARALIIGWIFIFFVVGEILGCLFAMKNKMYHFENNNWKLLLFYRCFSFCLSIPLIFTIIESPKFLLTRDGKRDQEAFDILNKLLGEDKTYLLTNELKEKISKQYSLYMHQNNRNNYLDLFNEQNLKLSSILFSIWYLSSYIYYGLIFILPSVYQQLTLTENKLIQMDAKMYDSIIADIIFSCIFEFPSNLLNGILPNMIGRKSTIVIGFSGAFISSLLCCFGTYSIPLFSAIIKCFINTAFGVLYIYTAEAYPTYMRTTGLGTCNFFARIGGTTTPFISQFLFKINYKVPFYGFAGASFFGLFLTLFLEETLGKTNY